MHMMGMAQQLRLPEADGNESMPGAASEGQQQQHQQQLLRGSEERRITTPLSIAGAPYRVVTRPAFPLLPAAPGQDEKLELPRQAQHPHHQVQQKQQQQLLLLQQLRLQRQRWRQQQQRQQLQLQQEQQQLLQPPHLTQQFEEQLLFEGTQGNMCCLYMNMLVYPFVVQKKICTFSSGTAAKNVNPLLKWHHV